MSAAQLLDVISADLWNAVRNLAQLPENGQTWHHWHGRWCGLFAALQRVGRLPVGPTARPAEEMQRLLTAALTQLPEGFSSHSAEQVQQWLHQHGLEATLDQAPGLQRHLLAGVGQQEDSARPPRAVPASQEGGAA